MIINPFFYLHFPISATLLVLVFMYWKLLSGKLIENPWLHRALFMCVFVQGLILLAPLISTQIPFMGGPTELILTCSWIVLLGQAVSQSIAKTKNLAFFTLVPVVLAQFLALGWGYNQWTLASVEQDFFLTHLLMSCSAWSAFSISIILGIMYIILERKLKLKQFDKTFKELPSLDKIETLAFFWLTLGTSLSFLSLIFGFLWWARIHSLTQLNSLFLVSYLPYLFFLGLFILKSIQRIRGINFIRTMMVIYAIVLSTHLINLHG